MRVIAHLRSHATAVVLNQLLAIAHQVLQLLHVHCHDRNHFDLKATN